MRFVYQAIVAAAVLVLGYNAWMFVRNSHEERPSPRPPTRADPTTAPYSVPAPPAHSSLADTLADRPGGEAIVRVTGERREDLILLELSQSNMLVVSCMHDAQGRKTGGIVLTADVIGAVALPSGTVKRTVTGKAVMRYENNPSNMRLEQMRAAGIYGFAPTTFDLVQSTGPDRSIVQGGTAYSAASMSEMEVKIFATDRLANGTTAAPVEIARFAPNLFARSNKTDTQTRIGYCGGQSPATDFRAR